MINSACDSVSKNQHYYPDVFTESTWSKPTLNKKLENIAMNNLSK